MRASRLVGLLSLLQTRGRMSTQQLASELEVSQRTILRDIEALSTAGIPVYAVRGRLGGFELLDGFTSELPATWYRPDRPPAGANVQRARIRLSPRGRRLAALLGRPAGLRVRRSPRPAAAPGGHRTHPAAGREGHRTHPGADREDRRTDPAAGREDWIEAWVRIDSADAAVLDMLALGAEVEVVHPQELRARIAETARRIADLHTGPPGRDGDAAIDPAPAADGASRGKP